MTLPRFFSRVADAVTGVAPSIDSEQLAEHLGSVVVELRAGEPTADVITQRVGYELAANLLARLYPAIRLEGPAEVVDGAAKLIHSINPDCDLDEGWSGTTPGLSWAGAHDGDQPAVVAHGWNVTLDPGRTPLRFECSTPAALAASALGVGEVFRSVFADHLAVGRHARSGPQSINLITLGAASRVGGAGDRALEMGSMHLAGAGAIGQAAVAVLRSYPAVGRITVVDPEQIDLGNLQRYVLTTSADPNQPKTSLIERACEGTSLKVESVCTAWGDDDRSGPGVDTVLVALDSRADRIAVQAGLPRAAYNAWTQPSDLGWSRHEDFGVEPCLACLYWPRRPRPNHHELVAQAFGVHPLRALHYLVQRLPVGMPLPVGVVLPLPGIPVPEGADVWCVRPLIADIAVRFRLDGDAQSAWEARTLNDLYREGICSGGLVRQRDADLSHDVLVPLAHQSALAGVMLATQAIVAKVPPWRRARPQAVEGRFDVLAGLPQLLARPRVRTAGCLCGDAAYQAEAARRRHSQ